MMSLLAGTITVINNGQVVEIVNHTTTNIPFILLGVVTAIARFGLIFGGLSLLVSSISNLLGEDDEKEEKEDEN